MTDPELTESLPKKTPSEVSEFEREQLGFMLSTSDVTSTLATINPSLAWLPVLYQMKVIVSERQLIPWIERNFTDVQAIRDVVANMHFFGPETASFLDYRLNRQADDLPPLLVKCWQIIVRAMKAVKSPQLQYEWFEISSQVKRGDLSSVLIERIADLLRPKLKVSKRLSLSAMPTLPQTPSDLMSIDYEVEEGVTADGVLEAWPEHATAEVDAALLKQLGTALWAALADAVDTGVEVNEGYSISDVDVPSVAGHAQNSYRSGFIVIVRVMADLWLRLASKSSELATPFVSQWRESDFRLMRRLALFACAEKGVSAELAASTLLDLPIGEVFLTNSAVEVFRLIRARWYDFSPDQQEEILRRLAKGPPRHWFREGADVDRAIDRCLYEMLAQMALEGIDIGSEAKAVLAAISIRWPSWKPRPAEQAGFHVWHESGRSSEGDASKLAHALDDVLVPEAKRLSEASDFMIGDDWRALCVADPDHALRGLAMAAEREDWPVQLWEQFLWADKGAARVDLEVRIANLLLKWPPATFGTVSETAASWLEKHFGKLEDMVLWPLWDRIADATLGDVGEPRDD